MAIVKLKFPDSVPLDQIDIPFLQGMLDRMAMGYHTYGHMRRKYERPDNIKNIRIRLKKYRQTGNTEWLIDASNFALMEFSIPSHPRAHFRSTDSMESPGAVVAGRVVKGKHELKPPIGLHAPRRVREGD